MRPKRKTKSKATGKKASKKGGNVSIHNVINTGGSRGTRGGGGGRGNTSQLARGLGFQQPTQPVIINNYSYMPSSGSYVPDKRDRLNLPKGDEKVNINDHLLNRQENMFPERITLSTQEPTLASMAGSGFPIDTSPNQYISPQDRGLNSPKRQIKFDEIYDKVAEKLGGELPNNLITTNPKDLLQKIGNIDKTPDISKFKSDTSFENYLNDTLKEFQKDVNSVNTNDIIWDTTLPSDAYENNELLLTPQGIPQTRPPPPTAPRANVKSRDMIDNILFELKKGRNKIPKDEKNWLRGVIGAEESGQGMKLTNQLLAYLRDNKKKGEQDPASKMERYNDILERIAKLKN